MVSHASVSKHYDPVFSDVPFIVRKALGACGIAICDSGSLPGDNEISFVLANFGCSDKDVQTLKEELESKFQKSNWKIEKVSPEKKRVFTIELTKYSRRRIKIRFEIERKQMTVKVPDDIMRVRIME